MAMLIVYKLGVGNADWLGMCLVLLRYRYKYRVVWPAQKSSE